MAPRGAGDRVDSLTHGHIRCQGPAGARERAKAREREKDRAKAKATTWPLDSPLLPSWLDLPRLLPLLPLLLPLHSLLSAVVFRFFAFRFAAFCSFAFLIDFA